MSKPASSPTRLRLKSPADVLSAVPYLLGFHPADSLVVVALGDRQVRFSARAELPLPDTGEALDQLADYFASVVAAQSVEEAILVAYGSPDRADRAIDAVAQALETCEVAVLETLRAQQGRYWSYDCTDPDCCPAEGTPYDVTSSPVAAAATVAGCVALPDRESLARSLAPLGGVSRISMRQATSRAQDRLASWAGEDAEPAAVQTRMVEEGRRRVSSALARQHYDGDLSDEETACLSLLLAHMRVRDEAWLLIDQDSAEAHLALWTHVLRRAEQPYVPAPACLLAFAAWQSGQGALAWVAVDRALEADPDYSMARLIADILARGIPPSAWRPPMTTDELAEAYAAGT